MTVAGDGEATTAIGRSGSAEQDGLKRRSRPEKAAAKQIRGSSVLLFGRFISMLVNLGIQVLTVNYLSKSDYGAFAYALSIVSLGENIATFGLDRSMTRFIPIYDEDGDYPKMFGTIVMVFGTVVGLGLATCLVVFGLQGWIGGTLISDPQAVVLLSILILLSPLQALDAVLVGLLAVFASPSSIFFRRHVLTPAMKLAVVGLLIAQEAGVEFLAVGYVAAGAIGVVAYGAILMRALRTKGLVQHFELRSLSLPYREVFGFTLPLLSSELVYSAMTISNSVLLGRYGGTEEVAAFRAVQPTARLNQFVFTSFTLLFTPLAARLFARGDREGLSDLYWQTAIWIAVFSFPVFALTFPLAGPITVGLFGDEYAESATYMALLSLGYYFNAALGFNGLTLKVHGVVRYIVMLNFAAAGINLALNFALIPTYGALGAAIGTCVTLVIHNILKQSGLRFGTSIRLFDWRYLRVYVAIAVGAVVLYVVQLALQPGVVVSVVLAGVVWLVIFQLGRDLLRMGDTFPELLRLPFGRRLFGGGRS